MKYMTQAWKCALAVTAALALLVPSTQAQTVFGGLSGTVTDPTGAVIPNAKIQATNEKTGTVSTTVSTSAGAYHFPELAIGTYDLTVNVPGFQTQTLKNIQINLQVTTGVNITMQVGSEAQTVTVSAGASQLQTQSSDITGSITDQEYLKLPLALGGVGAFRSPEAFIFLLPGSTGPGTANSPNGIFFSKIAGGQNFGAEVLIDGLSQQRSENGSSFDEEAPSVDALQELTVTQAVPPAQYNRTTGGIENFATKSGGNTFHGSAYELLRNTALDANNWFNGGLEAQACGANPTAACASPFTTPVDRKNDYGGTFSGPVWIPKLYHGHDRLFFFFAWEQLKYAQGGVTTRTIPTAQELSGDFSNPAILTNTAIGTNPCDGTTIYQGQIFDPSTTRVVNGTPCRTAFPGNKIPSTDFSSVAQKILAFYPKPTNNNVFNNFTFKSSSPIENTTYTVRIDANLTQNSKLWSSYSTRDNNRISGAPPVLPYPIDNATWKQDFETHFWRLGWDYSFSPNLLNHLIIGSNRTNSINFALPALSGTDWYSQLGLTNAVSNNFPVVTNGPNGGFTTQEGMPNNGDNIDNGLRLVESIAWQKGKHSLDIGTDIRYQQYSPINNNSPSLTFGAGQTAISPGNAQTGNGLASELLGEAQGGAQNIYAHQSRWISWYYSGYIQDDWKVTRNLTLNLGVNYSVDVPRHEAQNYTSNFSPTANDPQFNVPGALVFGTQCHCNTKWANTYYKDIAPRVGFAYSPPWLNGKTVLRGGAGIIYGPLQYDDFGGSMNSGYKSNPNFNAADNYTPAFQIDNGYPAFPQPPDLDPGLFNGTFMSGSYIEPDAGRPAKVYNYDLQVQQQLANDLILSVGFVGSEAQNLQANNQNINNIPLSDLALGNQLAQPLLNNKFGVPTPFAGYFGLWGNGVQIQQALRPFPQYDFIDSGCCLQNTGHSSYDALLVSLSRRFQNGLSLQASYTWQKNLNDTDSTLPNTNPGQPQVQNPANLHDEKAISVQDIPHTFVVSYVYELPFGRNKRFLNRGPLSYIGGGWQIGGIQRYQSGQPTAFCCASSIPGWQQSIRYSYIPNVPVKSPAYQHGHVDPFAGGGLSDPNSNSFFNGAPNNNAPAYHGGGAQPAFVDANLDVNGGAAGPYVLGNTPRVTGFRMRPWYNEDFSLLKDTPIRENLVFELKAEFLNAFNRHIFGWPNLNPAAQTFGVPTFTANSPRAIQITGRLQF